MNDAEQALAYAKADFSGPHNLFVELFRTRFGAVFSGRVLDLGCGAADICVRFATAFPGCTLLGIDAAPAMLALGNERIREQGLQQRIRLQEGYLPGASLPESNYDAVISNSLLHHLKDPQTLWETLENCLAPSGPVCLMDLLRPGSEAAARDIVRRHAGEEPGILQRDFYNSLLAAYRPEEIRRQLKVAGLNGLDVEVIDGHHLLISGRLY